MTKATVKVEYAGDVLMMAVNDDGYIVLRAPDGIADARFVRPTRWDKAAPWVFGSLMVLWVILACAAVVSNDYSRAAWCGSMACFSAVFLCSCETRGGDCR